MNISPVPGDWLSLTSATAVVTTSQPQQQQPASGGTLMFDRNDSNLHEAAPRYEI